MRGVMSDLGAVKRKQPWWQSLGAGLPGEPPPLCSRCNCVHGATLKAYRTPTAIWLCSWATAEDVLWADGVIVGSPTNMGVISWKMKKFWDEEMAPHWMKLDGKIGCAFSSAGGWGGGMELACQSILTVLMNFGFLVFGVTDYVSRDMTLHYGAVSAKAPTDEQCRTARRCLGRRLTEWTAT